MDCLRSMRAAQLHLLRRGLPNLNGTTKDRMGFESRCTGPGILAVTSDRFLDDLEHGSPFVRAVLLGHLLGRVIILPSIEDRVEKGKAVFVLIFRMMSAWRSGVSFPNAWIPGG